MTIHLSPIYLSLTGYPILLSRDAFCPNPLSRKDNNTGTIFRFIGDYAFFFCDLIYHLYTIGLAMNTEE